MSIKDLNIQNKENHYFDSKIVSTYLLLVSVRLIKYRVKTKHMPIRTSKSRTYRKIQVVNNSKVSLAARCL